MTNLNPDNLLIGCDPEVFVFSKTQDRYVSCHEMLPGTKAAPFAVELGAVQVDGLAAEFNIAPAASPEEFSHNVKTVISQLKAMIPEDCVLSARPTVEFGEEYMASLPDEVKELGCEPDYNAYKDGAENARPNAEVTFRTGAGHIHIGWGEGFDINDPEHKNVCNILTKQLDYYLGVALALYDTDDKRRQLYGQKGSYRPKSYGMEYRPLSNAWLRNEEFYEIIPKLVYAAWDNLKKTYPETSSPAAVETVFRKGTKSIHVKGLQDDFISRCGIKLPIAEELKNKGSSSVEVNNNPFNYTFTKGSVILTNFEEVAPLLDQTDILWSAGEKPSEYSFNTDKFVCILSGKLLYIDYAKTANLPQVNLMDHLGTGGSEEVSQFDKETPYFI